ncbi:trans-sialidase, putative [Trypanosoma cruzi marinkellei]|uniref:Trans-sialidase, putative n=1 Tax=Trypanosoma cruzi marinkellei TaxID=85056 RepID=K2N537_TRYCR|nr:trans-sialidase, putative [Trypanosoma cruzi marinkellei]
MHSRVAAVKAPRTHNRRRVAGSSGKSREGRESEPQRPNMSWRVFTSAVLLLLVAMWMCCCTGGAAQADKTASVQGSSPRSPFDWRDATSDETVSSLHVPSLVDVNGDTFAVAEAQLKKDESGFTAIASELLELSDETPKKELDKEKLKTQLLEECTANEGQCPSKSNTKVYVSRPTTVVNGNDIYMLVGNYSRTDAAGAVRSGADEWGLLLVKGQVSGEKKFHWKTMDGLAWSLFHKQNSLTRLIGGGGSGVKMQDGTLVLPVEGKKEKKAVSLIIYSSDTNNWKLSKGMSADGCSDPSVVEREKDKLMMMTACDDGRRRVYESGDKGDSWTEALGTLSRVWFNPPGDKAKGVGSGFITTMFDDPGNNRDVMLVTLPVYSKKENNGKGVLHLWLTDNTHIVDIGPVSGEEEDVAASSLFYTRVKNQPDLRKQEEELIALYEKKGGGETQSLGMVSVVLTEQLERVENVLETWKEADKRASALCPSLIPTEDASTDIDCDDVNITDGLVGFLSGSFSENTWKDEYLGVNATVTGGVAELPDDFDGVTFRGAWAEWPVGKQGENQLYHFANYDFTLLATVSIHNVPKGGNPIPLMGVRLEGEGKNKLMELSYDSGNKWRVLCIDGTTKRLSRTWEKGTEYKVAIVLQNGTQGSVYVDGKRVGSAPLHLDTERSKGISHFYIGGDGGSAEGQEDVSVTVTKVLLYNRPWTFSGEDADVEEVTGLPSEAHSPSVEGGQKAGLPAEKHPEASGTQAELQRPRQESEAKQKTTEGEHATTQQVPTAPGPDAVGEAADDAGTVRGSGLLPSLLLLGLWEFAAL